MLGGMGTAANGLNCLLMGLQLFTCGPVGWVAGTALVITGAATIAFGVNDILTVATGRNFIQELTGMSDQAYFWANLGLNIASTVFTMAGSLGKTKGLFCFPAGTGVLAIAANGMAISKPIEEIQVGDRVLSYNEETGQNQIKTVSQTFTSSHEKVVKVRQGNGQVITSSYGHPYYTKRGWIAAENLKAGDILQTVNGETVVVEFVEHVLLESRETLYNFEVDGNHNYYVADSVHADTSEFVLVHNKGCGVRSTKYIYKGKEVIAYKHDNGLYYAIDKSGHGYTQASKFKILAMQRNGTLKLMGDSNSFGGLVINKHSSNAGKIYKTFADGLRRIKW